MERKESGKMEPRKIRFPIKEQEIDQLNIGDMVLISGEIFCGRDAVLPKIAKLITEHNADELPFDLTGGLIFHTAVSRAGVGPTSSNKEEIEGTMEVLSKAGIKMHLGKGKLSDQTVRKLAELNSVYAVIPPVTALLTDRIRKCEVAAFPELGMEAFYRIMIEGYPAIIAAAKGEVL